MRSITIADTNIRTSHNSGFGRKFWQRVYTYDPFGNVTEMAGAEAAENPWRFSTKPVEAGTGWLYYGYRWYDSGMGRWVSRDPIEESGGVNLYGFVGNDGVGMVDVFGLTSCAEIAARIRDIHDVRSELGKISARLDGMLRLASAGAFMEERLLRESINRTMAELEAEIERLKEERDGCDEEIGKACCEAVGGQWVPRKSWLSFRSAVAPEGGSGVTSPRRAGKFEV